MPAASLACFSAELSESRSISKRHVLIHPFLPIVFNPSENPAARVCSSSIDVSWRRDESRNAQHLLICEWFKVHCWMRPPSLPFPYRWSRTGWSPYGQTPSFAIQLLSCSASVPCLCLSLSESRYDVPSRTSVEGHAQESTSPGNVLLSYRSTIRSTGSRDWECLAQTTEDSRDVHSIGPSLILLQSEAQYEIGKLRSMVVFHRNGLHIEHLRTGQRIKKTMSCLVGVEEAAVTTYLCPFMTPVATPSATLQTPRALNVKISYPPWQTGGGIGQTGRG
jgi:hypothetical protein